MCHIRYTIQIDMFQLYSIHRVFSQFKSSCFVILLRNYNINLITIEKSKSKVTSNIDWYSTGKLKLIQLNQVLSQVFSPKDKQGYYNTEHSIFQRRQVNVNCIRVLTMVHQGILRVLLPSRSVTTNVTRLLHTSRLLTQNTDELRVSFVLVLVLFCLFNL